MTYARDPVLTSQLWDQTDISPSKVIPPCSQKLHCLGRPQAMVQSVEVSLSVGKYSDFPYRFFVVVVVAVFFTLPSLHSSWHTNKFEASRFTSQILMAIRTVFNGVTPTSAE